MIEFWILGLSATVARALADLIEDQPDCPNRTEIRRRGQNCAARVGRTPQLAYIHNVDGTVDLGIPNDSWSVSKINALRPGMFVFARSRPADRSLPPTP